jgi:hypothetical protein
MQIEILYQKIFEMQENLNAVLYGNEINELLRPCDQSTPLTTYAISSHEHSIDVGTDVYDLQNAVRSYAYTVRDFDNQDHMYTKPLLHVYPSPVALVQRAATLPTPFAKEKPASVCCESCLRFRYQYVESNLAHLVPYLPRETFSYDRIWNALTRRLRIRCPPTTPSPDPPKFWSPKHQNWKLVRRRDTGLSWQKKPSPRTLPGFPLFEDLANIKPEDPVNSFFLAD